jgi:uncharacterized coiled-coil protein SlyX
MTQRQQRTIDSLIAEVAALKLRLSNRTAQVDLLLSQIQGIKDVLAERGEELEIRDTPPEG